MVLDQPLEVQREQLESVRYFRQSLLRVVAAAGHDHLLKMVPLVGLVVVVLPIQAQVVQLLQPVKVLLVVLTQLLEIKLLAAAVLLRLGLTVAQVVVTVAQDLQTVFLVPL